MSTTSFYYNKLLTLTHRNPLYLSLNNSRRLSSVNRNSKPSRFKKESKTLMLHQPITGTRNVYDKLVPPTSTAGLTRMSKTNKEKNLTERSTLLPREVLCTRIKAAFWISLMDPSLAKKTILVSNKILTS